MLKICFDKQIKSIKQDFSCDKEFSDVIAEIINRIIIDEYIKQSPKNMNLPLEEQLKMITEKRLEITELINKASIDIDYIKNNKCSSVINEYF